jgi:DNA-binding transcriptional LysR family regulator
MDIETLIRARESELAAKSGKHQQARTALLADDVPRAGAHSRVDISIRQIRYFIAASEAGSISRAAIATHVTQSAVTDAIKSLERQLGINLLERSPSGVSLTQGGRRFLKKAREIVTTLDDIPHSISQPDTQVSGRLRLGVSSMAAGCCLGAVLPAFTRAYGDVKVSVIEGHRPELESKLLSGGLDAALLVVSNLENTDAIAHRVLSRSKNRLWLHAGHPLLDAQAIHLRDIIDGPLVAWRNEELSRQVSRAWMDANLVPQIIFETSSVEAVRSLVASRAAMAIICDTMYRPWSLEGGRIEARELADRCMTTDLGVAWRRSADLPAAVRCFVEVCDNAQAGGMK